MPNNIPSKITVFSIYAFSSGRIFSGTGAQSNLEFTSLNGQTPNTFKDTVQNQIINAKPSELGNITSISSS